MKIYVAGHDQDEAVMAVLALRLAGHESNSSWVFDRDFGKSVDAAARQRIAVQDVEEVSEADAVLSLAAADRVPGGKHVEVGVAIALRIPCVHVGRAENIFHHHPLVVLVPDLEAAVDAIGRLRPTPSVSRGRHARLLHPDQH